MKVIFLDIDGVLNSETDFLEAKYYGHPHNEGKVVVSPGKLYLLEHIVQQTDAKIIISSTWRHHYKLSEIYEMFKKRGFTHPRTVIIGKTPDRRKGISSGPEYFRSSEITEWLKSRTDIDSYVILDDIGEKWFDESLYDNMVTTSEYDGLNFIQMNRAINILGRTEEHQKAFDEQWDMLSAFII